MKIKKGDNVLIISGKDKGKTGKVAKSYPKDFRVLIERINLRKKHIRPKKEGEKGQIVEVPAPVNVSNLKIVCPKCGKATRVGYKIVLPEAGSRNGGERAQKLRICKKCQSAI